MQYPPSNYTPSTLTVYNGQPTRALHAQHIDRYTTWLACGWGIGGKSAFGPVLTGGYYAGTTGGNSFKLVINVPAWTQHYQLGFLCSGYGQIVVGSSDDTYDATLDVNVGSGISGTHNVDDAQVVWLGEPMDSVADSTKNRALDVDYQDSEQRVTLDWTITDQSASLSLRVYSIVVVPMWPDEASALP